MKRSRWGVLFVVLYLALDFCDPSVPGVFFFDSTHLFMDSVVEVKALDSVGVSVAPSGLSTAGSTVTPSPTPRIAVAVPDVPTLCWWQPMKRDCLSSASRSPEDH